jgi:hypothetical protein
MRMEERSMLHRRRHTVLAGKHVAVLAGTLFTVAGCAPLTRERAPPPAVPLQLLGAESLELPKGCEPVRGQVYRTNYVVQPDGRVTDTASRSGDGCVEEALRSWVSSFRYGPIDAEMPVVIDWIAVTATRGG